jgi:RNA polymerase sigma-B factor
VPRKRPLGRRTATTTSARNRHDAVLLRQYAQTHDPRLREDLVERFLPLARSLAFRYRSGSEPLEDLIQVASEGLVRAIDSYDPERRNSFSSYATPMVLGALRHHFRDGTQAVHMPRGLQERIQRVNSVADDLRSEVGRAPTIEEVAERANLDREEVLEALQAEDSRNPMSIDRPARADGEETMAPIAEMIGAPETGYERAESSLAGSTANLDQREREALRLRFEGGMTQREIGDEIGVSQMQVSRLLRRALNKLLSSVRGENDPALTERGLVADR